MKIKQPPDIEKRIQLSAMYCTLIVSSVNKNVIRCKDKISKICPTDKRQWIEICSGVIQLLNYQLKILN